MREIKFRGWFQCITGREYWVYGYPSKQGNGNWEITTDAGISFTVEAVEQFTGLKDKNGTEIYEGDVLEYNHNTYTSKNWEVIFYSGAFFMAGLPHKIRIYNIGQKLQDIKVIGNIHEKHELLNQ